ncbi:hypothetical protein [Streptomyces sp. NPDC051183]|uniref:hypothetical protein n=1 Tax=Streptomyces sp. NPDC051183 TaxID=3155165 RepID=UPI0034175ED9
MTTSAPTQPLPDPYTDPAAHLVARCRQLHQANTELAGAFLHSAAPGVRALWPTASRVIFDRTSHDADPRQQVVFLRIEDAYGSELATRQDADALDRQDQPLLRDALSEVYSAVLHWNAGAVPGARPWSVESTYGFQDGATPPFLCTVTLPPAARPTS